MANPRKSILPAEGAGPSPAGGVVATPSSGGGFNQTAKAEQQEPQTQIDEAPAAMPDGPPGEVSHITQASDDPSAGTQAPVDRASDELDAITQAPPDERVGEAVAPGGQGGELNRATQVSGDLGRIVRPSRALPILRYDEASGREVLIKRPRTVVPLPPRASPPFPATALRPRWARVAAKLAANAGAGLAPKYQRLLERAQASAEQATQRQRRPRRLKGPVGDGLPTVTVIQKRDQEPKAGG